MKRETPHEGAERLLLGNPEIQFAEHGECKGIGIRYHWATGLSPEERDFVKGGGVLLVETGRPCGGNHGTALRQIVYNGRWRYRVPDEAILTIVSQMAPAASSRATTKKRRPHAVREGLRREKGI